MTTKSVVLVLLVLAGATPLSTDAGAQGTKLAPAVKATATATIPLKTLPTIGPPSCSGLPASCGPSGNSSCCTATLVSGGTFKRELSPSGTGSYPATVSNFRLDNFEVTVGRFRKFVAAYSQSMIASGAGKNPNNAADPGWSAAWNASLPADATALKAKLKCAPASHPTYSTWTDTAAGNENKPINCISWYEAEAFCIWDGGRLPTEAEWSYAAAGGSEQRMYPWSNPPASVSMGCDYANLSTGNTTVPCVAAPEGSANNVGSESPKGDGKWGQSDLAGNVAEWVQDWLVVPYVEPCINCAGLTTVTQKMHRGGSFLSKASLLHSWARITNNPTDRLHQVGARCARNP